jgi:lysophospholipase L1-like esterase
MSRLLPLLCVSLLSLLPASLPAAEGLQPNDLVAICGDSITEQKRYSLYIADYLLMCQPQPGLQAMQAGWSGETAAGFSKRLANDVLPFKPTVATTCYGMNDGGYAALTPERATLYRASTESFIQTLKKGGVRFLVIGGPGAVDTTTFKRTPPEVYNKTLSELGAIAREVAEKNGAVFADVHTPMIAAMAAAKAKYGAAYHVGGADGVHPAVNGHLVMAYAFLKALGCDGNIGTITCDLEKGTATATDGHKVLSSNAGVIEIESARYPFCFFGDPASPEGTRGMGELLPFNEDLNRFRLIVKNAPAEKCKVTWGAAAKEFSAADLAKGINLAAEFPDNPFSEPFRKAEAVIAKQQAFETPAIKVLLHSLPEWEKQIPESAGQTEGLSEAVIKKAAELRADSRAAVVPVKHTVSVEPVK